MFLKYHIVLEEQLLHDILFTCFSSLRQFNCCRLHLNSYPCLLCPFYRRISQPIWIRIKDYNMFTRLYKLNTPFLILNGLKTIVLFVQVGSELAIQSFGNQMLNKLLNFLSALCYQQPQETMSLYTDQTQLKTVFSNNCLEQRKKKKKKVGRITESHTAELCRRLLQINISNLYMNILSMTTTHKHTAKVLKSTQERLLSHQPAPDRIH